MGRVKTCFEENKDGSVRKAAQELGLGYGTVLKILQKKLCWKPYRTHWTHRTPALSPAHIETRLSACNFFLQFQEEWFERAIWTDEKMLVLIQEPHRLNDRTWAPVSHEKLTQCEKAGGRNAWAWTGIVDGRCYPLFWFQGSVNGEVYLDLLQNSMWPSVRALSTKKQHWYM